MQINVFITQIFFISRIKGLVPKKSFLKKYNLPKYILEKNGKWFLIGIVLFKN